MKHIVGFSGGIDSQAAALWVRKRYPAEDVLLTNSNAGGWEDPITEEFIANYDRAVHPVIRTNAIVADMWETPGFAETRGFDGNAILTFELMCIIKGRAPSRKAQFCTEKLKLVPQRRWVRATFGPGGPFEGEEFIRYTGVRRDESATRKGTPAESWDSWFDCPLVAPLVEWTKQQCFDAVKTAGEEINPLYSLGFNRVGCAPCINSSKADILNWVIRRPEMIDKVREFENRTGRTFFYPVRRNSIPNKIDEVLQWAKTSRGGKQELFPIMMDRESCESKYGLCE